MAITTHVMVGADAVLTVFDHESPQSPWGCEDGATEWPGMFDGLPDHLRARLLEHDDDEPMSVSDCFWYVAGVWGCGNPQPAEYDESYYAGDLGGAAWLLEPVLVSSDQAVRSLVVDLYERPDLLERARDLARPIFG